MTPFATRLRSACNRFPLLLLLRLLLLLAWSAPAVLSAQAGPLVPDIRYTLHPEDSLQLTFPLVPEFNELSSVQPDGYLALIGVPPVPVGGLTVVQAQQRVAEAYAAILHEPEVNIDVKTFRGPVFTVLGQVAKPGQYDLRQDLTVAEALAVGGGLTPMARTQVLLYRRDGAGGFRVHAYNLKAVLDGHVQGEEAQLRPGDMVFVPEKAISHIKKYVPFGLGLTLNPAGGTF